jgi:hypothetical protein
MPYSSLVYSVTTPLHVSGLQVAHHQEVTMCIYDSCYVLYVLVYQEVQHVQLVTYIHFYLLVMDY